MNWKQTKIRGNPNQCWVMNSKHGKVFLTDDIYFTYIWKTPKESMSGNFAVDKSVKSVKTAKERLTERFK